MMNQKLTSESSRAFTLIEVLISVSILILIFVFLYSQFNLAQLSTKKTTKIEKSTTKRKDVIAVFYKDFITSTSYVPTSSTKFDKVIFDTLNSKAAIIAIDDYLRKKIAKFDISKHLCSSYLRVEVKDLPGVLSSITKIFANNKISIKNLIQNPYKKNKKASIIIITHENLEKNYNNLLLNLIRWILPVKA